MDPEYRKLVCDPARLEALYGTGLMDSPPELGFDRITGLVGRLLEVPFAMVSLVDGARQFVKSVHGLQAEPWRSMREAPFSHAFCPYVVATNRQLVVRDAREEDLLKDNLAIPDMGVIAYIGFPILHPSGFVLGSLCAIDYKPRDWGQADLQHMEDLAALVAIEVRLRLEVLSRLVVEEKLNQGFRLAELESRGKTKFLADVTHELRTPLNAILGFTRLVRDGVSGSINAKQARYLDHIDSSGKHLLELVNHLLDESKVNSGKWAIRKESIDAVECLDSVLEGLSVLAESKFLSLQKDVVNSDWTIQADPLALKQILFNLVSNAIKFTSKGQIVVRAERRSESVCFSVKDGGKGIAAEDLERVFQAFERVDSGSAGTGLGLSVTKELVELHGGKIWVESDGLGRGSLFSFEIPH
jgi:signal transduction histidine kinase